MTTPFYTPPTYSTIQTGQPPPNHQNAQILINPTSLYTGTQPLVTPPQNHYNSQYTTPPYTSPHFTYQPFYPPLLPNPTHQFHSGPQAYTFNPSPKLIFPKFKGSDPKGWIIKADQYFDFINVEQCKKVKMVVMHFEDKAGTWFRYYQTNKENLNW